MRNRMLAGIVALLIGFGLSFAVVSADDKKDEKGAHGSAYGKAHGDGNGKYGHGRGYGMGGHHGTAGHLIRGLLGGAEEMGLTDEQIKKLKDIKLDLDRMRIQAEADIKIAEREARALMDEDGSSLSAIESKLTESAMKQVSLRVASVKARRDAMSVLTPEQSKRVKMFHEQMRERFRSGAHGKGGPHGKAKGGREKDDDD